MYIVPGEDGICILSKNKNHSKIKILTIDCFCITVFSTLFDKCMALPYGISET
jgi:hypothetical protein